MSINVNAGICQQKSHKRGDTVNQLKDLWLAHIDTIDSYANFGALTRRSLATWFEPLIDSITEEGAVPYLLETNLRYRASPLSSTITWLTSENLIPLQVLDKMQDELLYLRDANVENDPHISNNKKLDEDLDGWSMGEGVSVWSTSMAIIALLDPLGNGKKKAGKFKSSILWLAKQHDSIARGWAYQLSENCTENVIMTSLALRALALALEPYNKCEFGYTPDELRQICSAIKNGFDYLKDECKKEKKKTYWCFNGKPNCAATTWALLALLQISKTEEKIVDECKIFYKSVLESSLSFVLSQMPKTAVKWADEQIVCEAGAKYSRQKNYYSYSATLLPQLFELGVSPFHTKVIKQIDWLINSLDEDKWKIVGYDKTTVCSFTYAMVLSTLLCWVRHVGQDFSSVLLQNNTKKNNISKILFGFPASNNMGCQLTLKNRFWIYGGILVVLILIMIFAPLINKNVLSLANTIQSLWSKTSTDRHAIMINVISNPISYVIGALFFAAASAIRKFLFKKRGNKDD